MVMFSSIGITYPMSTSAFPFGTSSLTGVIHQSPLASTRAIASAWVVTTATFFRRAPFTWCGRNHTSYLDPLNRHPSR